MTSTGVPGDTYSLAWYCVQLLIDTIRDVSPPSQNPKGKGKAQEKLEADNHNAKKKADDRTHRLSLMLISTISSLPMTLMLRALDEIRIIIVTAYSSRDDSGVDDGNKDADADEASQSERKGRRKELLEALFSEILEKMGDREKEGAIKWWYTCRISESDGEGKRRQEGSLLGTVLASSTKRRRGVEKAKNGEGEENSAVLSRL